jgi:hypothetical protein
MAVPYTFGSATASIPLSQLDSNFATTITLGNTAIQLGNTVTTLNNMTLANVAVTSTNGDITVNTVRVGLGNASVSTNTAVGASALAGSNSGTGQNTAVGYQASNANTTGYRNVASGYTSMLSNTTGYRNSAYGAYSLQANTSGTFNNAFGDVALYANTTGTANNAFGLEALQSNTTGSSNTAFGGSALQANTTASSNTAVGYQAGYANTTGQYNVYIGNQAGDANTGNGANTFVGNNSGGAFNVGSGNAFNTFIGCDSGSAITTGTKNSILGAYNGNQGGLDIRTSSNYIVLSDGDGNPCLWTDKTNTTLNNPSGRYTILNWYNAATYKAQMYWDNTALQLYAVAGSNGVYLNNNANSWTSVSDERKKDIIEPITNAVNKVSTLRAVIGKYKTDEEGTRRSFLIAQDVQAVLPEAVSETESKEGLVLGMSYTDVIPLLVAAIKELKTIVDAQATTIAELQAKVGA